MTGGKLLAGVDIGGSKLSVLIADDALTARARLTVPTAGHGSDEIVLQVADLVGGAIASAGRDIASLKGVGIGVPGRVELASGTVSLAVNLHWRGLPLGGEVSRRLGVPVWVENDVRAAAGAIHELGLAGERSSLAYLSVGTGIAAGVVLDGRVWRGRQGLAGEIGHIVVDPSGPDCRCGLRGCLEAVASGPAIVRRAEDRLRSGSTSVLGDQALTAARVFDAAEAGDDVACGIAEEIGDRLAWAVHALVMTYDVEVVVLGGGATTSRDSFLAPLLRGLDRRRATSPLAAEVLHQDVVQLLPPDAEPGTWGALLLASRGLKGQS